MNTNSLTQIEEMQMRLTRAHALILEMQRVALSTDTADAEEGLNLIDALADALGSRVETMMDDAELLRGRVDHILQCGSALSDALEVTDAEAGHE